MINNFRMNFILRQVVLNEGIKEKPIEIHLTGNEVTVGRRQYLPLTRFPQVSRDHAIFYKSDDGAIFVKDLNSRNGVSVNDVKIGLSLKRLSVGDKIGLGVSDMSPNDGFLCILCLENPPQVVKHEVVDISSDEDETVADSDNKRKSELHNDPCSNSISAKKNCKAMIGIKNSVQSDEGKSISHNVSSSNRTASASHVIKNHSTGVLSNENFKAEIKNSKFKSEGTNNSRSCDQSFNHSNKKIPGSCNDPCSNGNVVATHATKKCNTRITREESSEAEVVNNMFEPEIASNPMRGQYIKNSVQSNERILISQNSSYSSRTVPVNFAAESSHGVANNEICKAQTAKNMASKTDGTKKKMSKTDDHFKYSKSEVSSRQISKLANDYNKTSKPDANISKTSVSSGMQEGFSKTDLPLKICVVPLVRCDPDNLGFSHGVKIPPIEKHQNSSSTDVKQTTESLQLNSCDSDVRENRRSSYLVHKTGNDLDIKKRKPSFSSSVDDIINITPSKKFCQKNETYELSNNKKLLLEKNSEMEIYEDMNYSQQEEVIYISDDDDYLDFNSSQNYVTIKEEPEDIEEHTQDDICRDIFQDIDNVETSDNFHLNQQGGEVESIESIKAFVQGIEQNDIRELMDHSGVEPNCSIHNKFFPAESQGFDYDVNIDNQLNLCIQNTPRFPDGLDSNQNLAKGAEAPFVKDKNSVKKAFSLTNVSEKKSTKTKLIDPQPMPQHPRSNRKREIAKKHDRLCSPNSTSGNKSRQSSANCSSTSNSEKFKIPMHKKDNVNHPTPYFGNGHFSNGESTSNNTVRKTSPVKRRPERFSSRMGFLVNPNDNAISTNEQVVNAKMHRKTVDNQKKNDLFSSGTLKKQNNQNSSQNMDKIVASVSTTQICKTVTTFIPNPRDPRQNRISHVFQGRQSEHGSFTLPKVDKQQDSSCTELSDKQKCNLNSVPSNSRASDKYIYNRQNSVKHSFSHDVKFAMIRTLINCKTIWLQEQAHMKKPPEIISKGATNLPLIFESYDSYVSSFYPMIMLELWEQMYVESKDIYGPSKQPHKKKFYFSVLSYTSKDDCMELVCESVVNEKVCFGPREGCIVILDIKENSKNISPLIGYIHKYKIQALNKNNLKIHEWNKLPSEWFENAKHWIFWVYTRKKEMSINLDSLMKGNGLCYIGNKLRWIDALHSVKSSPLLTDILQPRWKTFLINFTKTLPSREYNSGQMEVIMGVKKEFTKSESEPKVALIQGPPGTGKTHTIIGLLQALLSSHEYNPSFKILLTAPSNAAIDEIGCRVIALNKKSNDCIKFVRVGSEEQIHSKMKPYFLDKKAKDLFELSSQPMADHKEKELQNLKMQITRLERQPFSRDRDERLKYLRDKCKIYNNNASREMDFQTMMSNKIQILRESHIVLSTLSSCGISLLLKTFKPHSDVFFSYCIIDESTQCTEIEILQPLMLGINKLILVGDHKQLPATVLSKTACQHGFERSAFERFYLYFDVIYKKSPMYTLSEQYRMHSAICEFPSKYIYDKKVVSNPETDVKYENFPFLPYIFLDILISQESNDSSSKINCTEASVIINICTFLLEFFDSPSSIGIITPYQGQRTIFMNSLYHNPRYKNIEVNTVDGFQGREKDIIILSSVRANSQSGSIGFLACKRRLNVAITRAKKCLIICAHADSLINDLDWRALILDAKERNICFSVTTPKDIPMLFKYDLRKKKLV